MAKAHPENQVLMAKAHQPIPFHLARAVFESISIMHISQITRPSGVFGAGLFSDGGEHGELEWPKSHVFFCLSEMVFDEGKRNLGEQIAGENPWDFL